MIGSAYIHYKNQNTRCVYRCYILFDAAPTVTGTGMLQGRIQDFYRGGAAGPGGAVFRGRLLRLFVPEGRPCWPERRRICLEGRRRGRKVRLFVPEGRLRRREDAHVTPSMLK